MGNTSASMRFEFKELNSKLASAKSNLAFAKENNSKLLHYKKEYEDSLETRAQYEEYIKSLDLFHRLCVQEANRYKNKRIGYMCKFIDDKLDIVFPDEQFTSEIVTDFKSNANKTYLQLRHMNTDEIEIPGVNQGKLCQQLLSFSSATALIKCLGIKSMFLDEAFSASAPQNLTKIGSILKSMVGDGMQIILIEQEDDVYKDIPRREIYVYKDSLEKETKVKYEKDY